MNYSICKANGLEIIYPQDLYVTYKYFLGTGNNSKLIKQCFSHR